VQNTGVTALLFPSAAICSFGNELRFDFYVYANAAHKLKRPPFESLSLLSHYVAFHKGICNILTAFDFQALKITMGSLFAVLAQR
jgi:hypothetical protein